MDTSTSPPWHVAKLTFYAQSAPLTLCGHGNMGGVKSAWASTKKSAVYAFASVVPMCMHSFHAILSNEERYVSHQLFRARPICGMPSNRLLYWRIEYAIRCSWPLYDIDMTIYTQCVLRLRSVESFCRRWGWDECNLIGMVMGIMVMKSTFFVLADGWLWLVHMNLQQHNIYNFLSWF